MSSLALVVLGLVLVPASFAQNAGGRLANLSGRVQDSSGAVVPGAHVELRRASGELLAARDSDGTGQFRLEGLAAGAYSLSVVLAGFEPVIRPVRISDVPTAMLTITMNPASVATNIEVNATEDADVVAPDRNLDAASVSVGDMKSLPIFDADIVATMSAFLDVGAAGEGGATLLVDGVERSTVGMAPSAIERVSINQDPYSAQYYQPGRGQVEVITKSTAESFHGSASFTFRDAALNAKNYFATTKPPEQRRIYEGYLTGPVKPLRNTAFLFSLTRQEEDTFAQVDATTLPQDVMAPVSAANPLVTIPEQNVATPNRSTALTMKVSHQYNEHHSAYVLFRMFDGSRLNPNIGGLVLASAGYTETEFNTDLTYHDDLTFGANKLNQLTFLVEHNNDTYRSNQQSPQIVVEGGNTFGGAQFDQVNTENNPKIIDIFSWTLKTHQLKFGVQMPNLGRRILEDKTNRQGTYTFASAAAYVAGTPSTFSLQQGQVRFETLFAQPGVFFQDQIQATPRLTVTAGARYDWQNTLPGTMDALQPRLSLAYLLDKKHAMVVRAGSGVYVRRVGVNIGQQLARYEYAAERSLLLSTNLCFPNINVCNPLSAQPPSLFNYQPDIKSPVQAYFGLTVERQITKGSTLTVGYNGYRGWHALRSIDVNAPPPPFTSFTRPNPAFSQVLQLNSGGYQKTDGLSVSYRGRIGHVYSGFLQYGYEHADTDTQYSTFIPQNQYDPNAEWSRSDTDQRHRLALFGTFYPDKPLNLGVGFYNYTPYPYSITTGTDDYHDGLLNARPAGVPRNSLNGAVYQDLQLRLNYNRKLRPKLKDASPTLGLSLSSFNTLNRINFKNYVGVITSPLFMQPTTADNPRRLQLGASYSF